MKFISMTVATSIVASNLAIAPWLVASSIPLPNLTSESLARRSCAIVDDPDPPLNVRSGPGTDFRIIGQLNNGTQVAIVEEQNGWYRVVFNPPDGTGWVAGNRVRVVFCD